MTRPMTRREMLQAAGGVTFLGLTPIGCGYAASTNADDPSRPLLYTAAPYIQPGPASKLVENADTMAIQWQTEDRPASFTVEYGENGSFQQRAPVARTKPYLAKSKLDARLNYSAGLSGLKLGTKYTYRVSQDATLVAEGYFTTRKPRGAAVKFVAFGDNSYGDPGQRAVAFHAYKALPDFVMNTGDNVYDSGLDSEYVRYFYPIYNADAAAPTIGAPLLRSVPFYTVIGNHDVRGKSDAGGPAADFAKNPDSLGFFTVMNLPANGPTPPQTIPLVGKAATLDQFKTNAPRYPKQTVYSFDVGDCHFLCLDSNLYIDPTDHRWHEFIAADLGGTDAKWKFVVYHHPAFNVGDHHYKEQHLRLFTPTFERFGVDFVLSGHEHNYQRTRPMKFRPNGSGQGAKLNGGERLVPGVFTVDSAFDGKTKTKPDGVIYITTGAGGRHLYGEDFHGNPARWIRPEDGNVAYVANLVADRHSFTTFDVTSTAVEMRQIDQWGHELDAIRVTKA